MKLQVIESILDSIDIYQVVKDMGLNIIHKPFQKENPKSTYASTIIYSSELRIFNTSFLNFDLFNQAKTCDFYSGSGIDLLAYYYKGNYTKALDAYFELYGATLKSKLIHEPTFIKGIIKDRLVKRHEVLKMTLNNLFAVDHFNKTLICKSWVNKQGVDNTDNIKGFAFSLSSKELHKYLAFIFTPNILKPEQMDTFDLDSFYYSQYTDADIYKDSSEWIVIPYFADYSTLSYIKLINPNTNASYCIYLDNVRLAYAGLFSLNKYVDFKEKIRLLESTFECAVLIGNSKKLLNSKLQYLAIGTNPKGISAPTLGLNKPIFLYKPNTSVPLMKGLNDNLPNFYICEYNKFIESSIVYTWETFMFKLFKKFVTEDAMLSPRIKTFLSIIDFSSFSIKRQILDWLKQNGFSDIYESFNLNSSQVMEFKAYIISATSNGYIATSKKTNETTVISNFIIRLENTVIFKNKDDMLINGYAVMGSNEFPVKFFKKELAKKDALENIALKAFSNFNVYDNLLAAADQTVITNNLPLIIDKGYSSALSTIINMELSKIPCVYGNDVKGWDKLNNIFATPCWKASGTSFSVQKQYFYANTICDNIYATTLPKLGGYKNGSLHFLNCEVKNMIGLLLAYMYRSYFSYELKPFYVLDNKNARNLLKFIFAALGQRRVFEYDINDRLIKNKKVFSDFNNYPILVRTNAPDKLCKIQNYPYVLISSYKDILESEDDSLYSINLDLRIDDYPKVTNFAVDTFERFFKWLFSLKVEEYDLESNTIQNQEQLIMEGNQIFDMLWWDEVKEACKKNADYLGLFRKFLSLYNSTTFARKLHYAPEDNVYICTRINRCNFTPEERVLYGDFYSSCRQAGVVSTPVRAPYYKNFLVINKEFMLKALEDVEFKDNKKIDITQIPIFLSKQIISETHSPAEVNTRFKLPDTLESQCQQLNQ